MEENPYEGLEGGDCALPADQEVCPGLQDSPQTLGFCLQLLHQKLLGLQLLLHLAQLQGGGLKVAAVMSSFHFGSGHLEGGTPTSPGAEAGAALGVPSCWEKRHGPPGWRPHCSCGFSTKAS